MAAFEKFDLCVIGAGPAGIAAAQSALALGATVALVEAVEMGGVALNWGALPAHALAASARRAHHIRTAAAMGIGADEPRINFARINARIKAVIESARPEVSAERLAAMGAEIIRHSARFTGRATIEAGERRIRARHFILATGSRPHVPPIPGLANVPYLTPETIFDLPHRPGHLVVIGAGATGTVLAQAYRRLGAEVTLIDMLDPLGCQDREFAAIVTDCLAHEGVDILAHTGVVSVEGGKEEVRLTLKAGADDRQVCGTHLLVATGRTPNTDALGLEKAGVKWSQGEPLLDTRARTTNKRIYCVGDAGGTRSVQAARFMGAWAARQAVTPRLVAVSRPPVLPRLIATDPEIAVAGLTESQARAHYGQEYEVTRYPLSGLDRARARGSAEGHVKLVTARGGRIVGAALCGEGAGEIVAVFALAIARRLTPFDLHDLLAPYPALSEVVTLIAAEYESGRTRSAAGRLHAAVKRLLP